MAASLATAVSSPLVRNAEALAFAKIAQCRPSLRRHSRVQHQTAALANATSLTPVSRNSLRRSSAPISCLPEAPVAPSSVGRRTILAGAAMTLGVRAAAAESGEAAPATAPLPPPKKVFVAGATGRTGQRIVRALAARGIKVQAGVRSLSKAREVLADVDTDLLEVVEFDVLSGVDTMASVIAPDADAIIVATGFAATPGVAPNPFMPWQVDNVGTKAIVDAARKLRINRLVLVSSILTNGAAWGQLLNPAYLVLNLFGLVLLAKLQAERYIQASGINYTIVRPGGLKETPPSGGIVASGEDTLAEGSISRQSVAEVAVEALLWGEASYKVVEIVERADEPKRVFQELFRGVK